MTHSFKIAALLSPAVLSLASCAPAQDVDTTPTTETRPIAFIKSEHGVFQEGWAMAFVPDTNLLAITQKSGTLIILDTKTGERVEVSGMPKVDYGGQGGLGDIAFGPAANGKDGVAGMDIFLSWAEAGEGGRGAVVGRGALSCLDADSCRLDDLSVIWRQSPKTGKRGHYSHRLLISPDEKHLYIASGDRQEREPAQDKGNTLGTIVKLNLDGTPAADNPWPEAPSPTNQIWSWGHRNILGMDWDAEGRLWEIEHGPAGGDELNLVKKAANYGWPTRSNGDHYNGKDIPDHSADDGFEKPKAHWTPVLAPGDMLIYRGEMFGDWKGDAVVAGLGSRALTLIDLDGENAREEQRIKVGGRLRALAEGPDGALWVLEDGEEGRLLKLSR